MAWYINYYRISGGSVFVENCYTAPTVKILKNIKKWRLQTIFFACAWLFLTAGAIFISSAGYYYASLARETRFAHQENPESSGGEVPTGAGLPETDIRGVQTVVETDDGRAEIVAKFLERHNSPMQPHEYYGQKLVEIADRYNLDFRLLPAIAMQESNLCRNTHSEAPHNCLGFGIHERGTLDFESYEAGFERAGLELRAFYVDQGRITTEQLMRKYTPSSDGSWANSVDQWMAEMRYDDRALGRELKENDTSVLEFAQ